MRYDSKNGGKTKAGSLARPLGSEERLEQVLHGAFVHAGAGVLYPDTDIRHRFRAGLLHAKITPEPDIAGLDSERATVVHGFAAIDHQVHQHLMHLAAIGFDCPQSRSQAAD